MTGPGPAAAYPEDEGAGREVHDGMQAAAAVLEGEPIVILRSENAEAQAGKVNALRAALHGRPIRGLRLDGKHPRGLSPLASPEPEADRAVLVVEHADTLDPATLDALRDVENLQLVLFHRIPAFAPAGAFAPSVQGALTEASFDLFPPGSLIAFDLDPRREHWGVLLAAILVAAVTVVLLVFGIAYYDLPWRFWDTDARHATAQVSAPPQLAAAPAVATPPAPAAIPSTATLPQLPAAPAATPPEVATAPTPPSHAERTVNQAPAPTEPGVEPGASVEAPQTSAAANPQPAPASRPQATETSPPGPTPLPSTDQAAASSATPITGQNSTDLAPVPLPSPPVAAAPDTPPTTSRAPGPVEHRAQLQRDFDRFLAGFHHRPRHLTHAQRKALFDKFLIWRDRQAAQANR